MDQLGVSPITGAIWSAAIALFALATVGVAGRRLANGNGSDWIERSTRQLPGCLSTFVLLLVAFLTALTIYLISSVILAGIGGEGEPDAQALQPTVAPASTFTDPDISVQVIFVGDTQSFFGNELYIGVNTVSFDRVTFTTGSPGVQGTHSVEQPNGFSFIYDGRIQYDVRITRINHHLDMQQASVEFTVTRLIP